MNNQLTVLIPTSPIPSHPSTEILDETISNLRKYTDAKIVIMFDGIHKSLESRRGDYLKYMEAVHNNIEADKYGYCTARVFSEHTHQAQMTKTVLQFDVNTPLILFCEHDCSPIGEIPFKEICDLVELNSLINYIRFNIFHEVLEEHLHLMIDKFPMEINGIKLTRTIQFSARPHIAKTDWYVRILDSYFRPFEKSMIEDRMHGIVQESYKELGHDIFGLAIYTPDDNQLRSYHSDGRGSDEKIIEA